MNSGGLYRAQRILETMREFDLDIVDSDTTNVDRTKIRGRLRIFSVSRLRGDSRWSFLAARVLNYTCSLIALVWYGLIGGPYDAVYVPTSELPHVALAGWLVARIKRVPLIFCNLNVRGTDLWLANRLLHREADAVITISSALASELRREGVRDPILIGSVGVDDGSVPRAPFPLYDAVFVARHTIEKGTLDLLAIWRLVCDQRPGSRLLTLGSIGPAMRREVELRLSELGLAEAIEMRGPVSEREKWDAYSTARVCVFPSHVEGWGIVPIEAHLAGLPVVAYDLAAYDATIASSPGATLVPTGETAAFADAVLASLDASSFDRPAMRQWAAQFTWESATALEEELLKRSLRLRGAAQSLQAERK